MTDQAQPAPPTQSAQPGRTELPALDLTEAQALIERLEAFPNPNPERDYEVSCETDELTCNCPFTGQPDFATVAIAYTPDQHVVELKSLKMYLWGFRDIAIPHELITNQILNDLVEVLAPRKMKVETRWKVRGGITTTVTVEHPKQHN